MKTRIIKAGNMARSVQSMEAKGYKLHHTAWCRGYISRKIDGVVDGYTGRFGAGYAIHLPTTDSTRFHVIAYMVK